MTHRTPRRLALVHPSLITLVLLAVTTPAGASPESGSVPLTDPEVVLSVPPLARPPFLTPVLDPAFGTMITRIAGDTGHATFPASGRWGSDARHAYSKQQPWNSDGTLMVIQNRSGGTPSRLFLDGQKYLPRVAPCPNDPLYDYRWHPSPKLANTMINVNSSGTELMWFDVVTCTKTRSWTLPIEVDYGIGSGEGNPSNDGRFVCLANDTAMFVVDMDPKPPFAPWPNQRIGPLHRLVPCDVNPEDPSGDCRVGNVSISPSGRYVDVKFAASTDTTQDMHRIFAVDPVTLELSPQSMDPASLRCGSFEARTDGWIYPLKHADMALDPFDGDEDVIIGGRSCPGSRLGRVVKVRLRDGRVTALTDPTNEPSFQHASARNLERPGWVYVGYYKADGRKYSDEIVAVKLDGSGTVERYAHKRSVSSDCYRCESHPVPSRDGQRILFASNWAEDCGAGCGSTSDIKDYVVSLPGGPIAVESPAAVGPAVALAVSMVNPTPAVSRAAIHYTLAIDEPVRLEIHDAAGRRVETRDLGRPGTGHQQVDIERRRNLPAGVYWVRLTAGPHVATGRVVFIGR
jgi:hypothetical protein